MSDYCVTPETAAHQAPPFLGWEDSLEKEMATCSSILAEKSYGQKEPGVYSLFKGKHLVLIPSTLTLVTETSIPLF